MAAVLSVRLTTGAVSGSLSAAVTGIDLISADNNLNTLANRQANPITIPSVATTSQPSYEKWMQLRVDTAPANSVSNFKFWCAQGGAFGAGTGVQFNGEGAVVSYVGASSTLRGTASAIPTTQGAAGTWDSASYSAGGNVTKFLVVQLVVISTAGPGNITQMTLSFSYDET